MRRRQETANGLSGFQDEALTERRSAVWFVGFKGDPKNNRMDTSKLGRVPAQNAADEKVDGLAEKGGGYTAIR